MRTKHACYCEPSNERLSAFSLVEMLVTIAIIGILFALLFPVLSKTRGKADRVVCVNNLRQLMLGVTMYGGDNQDVMVYPGRGDIYGPYTNECWLFGKNTPLIEGDASEAAIAMQVEYRKTGMLYSYYRDARLLQCPNDVEGRMDGQQRGWYLQRRVKLSSFTMNGSIQGAYHGDPDKWRHKISEYRPDGIVFIEANERLPLSVFSGGASFSGKAISQRHGAKEFSNERLQDVGGGSVCASFDGSAEFIGFGQFVKWAGEIGGGGGSLSSNEVPNRVYCYPDDPRGGADPQSSP